MDRFEFSQKVETKEGFQQFILFLVEEINKGAENQDWVNISLKDYLNAIHDYVLTLREKNNSGEKLPANQPSW